MIQEIEYRSECAYVTLTVADTMYGHEVIQNVLYSAGLQPPAAVSDSTSSDGGKSKYSSGNGAKNDASSHDSGSPGGGNSGVSTTGGFEKEDFEHDKEAPHVVFVPYDSKINAEHGTYSTLIIYISCIVLFFVLYFCGMFCCWWWCAQKAESTPAKLQIIITHANAYSI